MQNQSRIAIDKHSAQNMNILYSRAPTSKRSKKIPNYDKNRAGSLCVVHFSTNWVTSEPKMITKPNSWKANTEFCKTFRRINCPVRGTQHSKPVEMRECWKEAARHCVLACMLGLCSMPWIFREHAEVRKSSSLTFPLSKMYARIIGNHFVPIISFVLGSANSARFALTSVPSLNYRVRNPANNG